MRDEEMLKEVFREAKKAKDKALKLAEQKFPTLLSLNKAGYSKYLEAYSKYVEKTEGRLLKELRIKYGITGDQLEFIIKEGNLKGWSSLSRE